MTDYTGYQTDFLGKKLIVSYPRLSKKTKADLIETADGSNYLDYIHYSLLMSKSRRFPYFTATNIDGKLFRSIKRTLISGGSDKWVKDERAGDFQWGQKLYDAPNSPYHRGHMTKREDPQWGDSDEAATEAARSTFYFTNSVPQIGELNSHEWAGLERYILSRQAVKNKLKINLFTGPVLSLDDPYLASPVEGKTVQMPMLFWKMIYFSKDGKKLSRVAFLMGHQTAMFEKKIVVPKETPRGITMAEEPLFADYEDAATYQVNCALIEKLTGLNFKNAQEPYKDERPIELILKDVEVHSRVPLDAEREGLFTHKKEYKGIVL